MTEKVHLTKKRQLWVKNRSVTMKGLPLRNSITNEDRYAKKLEALTKRMTDDVEKQIKRLFKSTESKEYYAQDASIGAQARMLMNGLTNKYMKMFRHLATPYATSMVSAVNKAGQMSLFHSVEKMTGGAQIKTSFINNDMKDQIAAGIAENVALIKSIPQQYLNHVGGAVMRSITQPNQGGIAELQGHIDSLLIERRKPIHNKAKNIAYDQTRKMYNNLNASRMEAIGIQKYEWVHSGGGQRPREFHRDVLNGQIFRLDDPPIIDEATGERGIPSTLINCRCTMLPLLEFDDGSET